MKTNEKLDITPELAISAYNILKQYAKQTDCNSCIFYKRSHNICIRAFLACPSMWAEIEKPKRQQEEYHE